MILYPAERILEGQVPYRDFFSELAPGTFFLQALWFKLLGIHIWAARIPILIIMSGIAVEMLVLSRMVMTGAAALAPVLIYTSVAFPRWTIVSHHWYSLFFALFSVIMTVKFLSRRRASQAFLAGIGTAAAGFCMQTKGVFLLLGITALLLWNCRKSIRRPLNESWFHATGWYLAGVLLASSPAVIYFGVHHALRQAAYSTFTFLWQNYLPYEMQPFPHNPLTLFTPNAGKFAAEALLAIVVPAAAVGCALNNHLSRFRYAESVRARRTVDTFLLLGGCLLASEMHRFDYMHMLFATPLLLVLAMKSVDDGLRRVSGRTNYAQIVSVVICLFCVGRAVSLVVREQRRSAPIYTRRGTLFQTPERSLVFQRRIDEMQARVPEGSHVFVFPYSAMLYFLTGTHNPTRFDYALPAETTPAQYQELLSVLRQGRLKYVFSFWKERRVTMRANFSSIPDHIWHHHPVEEFLENERGPYRLCLEDNRFRIFARNSDSADSSAPPVSEITKGNSP